MQGKSGQILGKKKGQHSKEVNKGQQERVCANRRAIHALALEVIMVQNNQMKRIRMGLRWFLTPYRSMSVFSLVSPARSNHR